MSECARLRLNMKGDHLCTHMNVLCVCISKLGSYEAKNVTFKAVVGEQIHSPTSVCMELVFTPSYITKSPGVQSQLGHMSPGEQGNQNQRRLAM